MQVRELIELLSKEPQTATVVAMYDGDGDSTYFVEGVLDYTPEDNRLILEIES